MKISATQVVEEPQMVVEHRRELTGTMPPPPPAPAAEAPILIAEATPVPSPVAPTPAELPATGSMFPLIGLLGLLSLLSSFGMRVCRNL